MSEEKSSKVSKEEVDSKEKEYIIRLGKKGDALQYLDLIHKDLERHKVANVKAFYTQVQTLARLLDYLIKKDVEDNSGGRTLFITIVCDREKYTFKDKRTNTEQEREGFYMMATITKNGNVKIKGKTKGAN